MNQLFKNRIKISGEEKFYKQKEKTIEKEGKEREENEENSSNFMVRIEKISTEEGRAIKKKEKQKCIRN